MTTYNGEEHLQVQLDSFLEQTRLPDELVVVDDNSTDATLEVLEAFQRRAPFPVRIEVNPSNIGVDANFDKALSLTSGDIIMISDQDDYGFVDKISMLEEFFLNSADVHLVVNNQIITDDKLSPSGFSTLENFKKTFGTDQAFGNGCCLSFRRSWLDFIRPIPVDSFNYDLWINSLAVALQVRSVISKPLQFYRRHDRNVSQSLAFETREMSRADYFSRDLGEDHRELWRRQIDNVTAYRGRILERREHLLTITSDATIEHALAGVEERRAALELRTRVRSVSRALRAPLIVKMLAQGRYGYFSGLPSALRDLVVR
jgi:glycosyltransferase involved in cell wall biosynthesis